MNKLEQLASAHESFSDLLHAIDPAVLIGIVCAAAGVPLPRIVEVSYRNPRIEIPGLSKSARKSIVDLVYTVLGCLFHAQDPATFEARVQVFRAAWMAIQSLAETQARRYSVVVMSIVPDAVIQQGIAELREAGELDEGRWELFGESERKGHSFARGHREGLEEGLEERRELLRRVIVDVLELRGFEVAAAARDRIQSCESLEVLEGWYAAAKSAATTNVEQLFDA
jgi:hypothetical protein